MAIAYIGRGTAWRAKGEVDRAFADDNEAIRLDPKLATAYNNRGNTWRAKGNNDRAIADYNEAIRLDPITAYDNRGNTWVAKGDNDRAIADYNEALKINPKQAFSLFGRGLAKLKKGDASGGEADIAAAKAIQTNIAEEFGRYRLPRPPPPPGEKTKRPRRTMGYCSCRPGFVSACAPRCFFFDGRYRRQPCMARVKNLETRDRLVGVGGGIRASIGNACPVDIHGVEERLIEACLIFLRDDEHLILLGGEFLGEFGFANAAVHSDLGELLLGNVGMTTSPEKATRALMSV
jgi:tetratricopeptide (TPR) repeat protein